MLPHNSEHSGAVNIHCLVGEPFIVTECGNAGTTTRSQPCRQIKICLTSRLARVTPCANELCCRFPCLSANIPPAPRSLTLWRPRLW